MSAMLDELAQPMEELRPDPGSVVTAELLVTDDVLVKLFALGPDAEVDAHDHPNATNVFHVIEGTVTVTRGDDRERLSAPAIVSHERGTVHGARNETDERAVFTASLCPLPGSD